MNNQVAILRSFIHLINNADELSKHELLQELEDFARDELSVLRPYSSSFRDYFKFGHGVYDRAPLYLNQSDRGDTAFTYGSQPPVMGFELELEASKPTPHALELEEIAANILSYTEDVMCKRDGSLQHGFEIISQPATYFYYENHFNWSWLKEVIKSDFIVNGIGERGFHIHINRASFVDEAHTQRFADAIVADVKMFQRLSVDSFFAPEHRYCATRTSNPDDSIGRYCAVNLLHRNTVEVRCFEPVPTKGQILTYMQYMLDTQEKTKGEQK
jgi:hypothetical protein